MISVTQSFKDNIAQLPSIDGILKIEFLNAAGEVVSSIENQPGKQGSLSVYNYLQSEFGTLDVDAAKHGLEVFAEHTVDAKSRPGAHPNVDRLLDIISGAEALTVNIVRG